MDDTRPGESSDDAQAGPDQVPALLASALNMTSGNEIVHDAIADALNALA